MKLNRKAERLIHQARDTLFPPRFELNAEEDSAQQAAVALWRDLFQPFGPSIEDADVIEIGCGDGRLAGRLLTHGAARSATGVAAGSAFALYDTLDGRLSLSGDLTTLDALDDQTFDLMLARELDSALPLEGLERRLSRLYDLLRPGGEALVRLRCFDPETGAGYGFMTPTAWAALLMRTGFEIVDGVQLWRDDRSQARIDGILSGTSPEERASAELRLHLARPWEGWELTALTTRQPKRRR